MAQRKELNVKISDRIFYLAKGEEIAENLGTISKIGILNEHGYPMNFRVGDRILNPHDSKVAVVPPPGEWPEEMGRYIAEQGGEVGFLVIARACENRGLQAYRIIHADTLCPLEYVEQSIEVSDLVFYTGDNPGWRTEKPVLARGDGEVQLDGINMGGIKDIERSETGD